MKNATHRVVILKNLNSEIVSQAILFLKNEASVPESRLIAEAEKIVEKYMSSSSQPSVQPANSYLRDNITKLICVAIFAIGLVAGVAFFF